MPAILRHTAAAGDIIVCVEITKSWWSGYTEVRADGTRLEEEGADPTECDVKLFPPNFTNDTGGWRRPSLELLGPRRIERGGCDGGCCGSSQRSLRTSIAD